MNKFLTSALALSVAGSLAHAGTNDEEWLELDREIESLAAPVMSPAQGGVNLSALIRVNMYYSDDDLATGGGEDIFGVEFQDIDLATWGQVGDFMWRVSGDFDTTGGDLSLEDGYVSWNCYEGIYTKFGSFKAPALRSQMVNPENLLFTNRTALGSVFDFWDAGVGVHGTFEDMFNWYVSVMNGANGPASDHAYYVRAEYMFGEGAADVEGALGAGEDFAGTIGVMFANFDDLPSSATGSDDFFYALDFWGTAGPIGFGAEVAQIDDGIAAGTDEDFSSSFAFVGFDADSTPWDLTGSYLINEEVEAGIRYEDSDNDDDTKAITLGVNWYRSGHNAKWQASVTDIDSDTDALEGTIWQVGVSVGSSGSF